MRPFAFACLLPLAIFVAGASAHEVRPAYLQLHQANAETYDVFWKVPGQGDLRLGIYVQLPEGCTTVSEPRRTLANNVYTEHWTFKRLGGLNGSSVGVT